MDKIRTVVYKVAVLALLIPVLACSGSPPGDSEPQITDQIEKVVTRDEKIPENAVKVLPETDDHPPVLFSNSFEIPVPLPGEVNTAGAEDSPFVSPDGDTLYFFFTPDVNVPVEKQIQDGVTGIYVSKLINDQWGTPERVLH